MKYHGLWIMWWLIVRLINWSIDRDWLIDWLMKWRTWRSAGETRAAGRSPWAACYHRVRGPSWWFEWPLPVGPTWTTTGADRFHTKNGRLVSAGETAPRWYTRMSARVRRRVRGPPRYRQCTDPRLIYHYKEKQLYSGISHHLTACLHADVYICLLSVCLSIR